MHTFISNLRAVRAPAGLMFRLVPVFWLVLELVPATPGSTPEDMGAWKIRCEVKSTHGNLQEL